MAIPVSSRKNLQRFSQELQGYDLNFENVAIHSRLKEFEKRVEDSGLSIKLGVRGKEHYFFKNQQYSISPDHYLVVNKHQQFDCYLRSNEMVEAICLYLSEETVSEVWHSLNFSLDRQMERGQEVYQLPFTFMERTYHVKEDRFGAYLKKVRANLLHQNVAKNLDFNLFYYQTAEELLMSHRRINRRIDQIRSARRATREELYRRLLNAHQYILDNFTKAVSLDELARKATLSKYHLLRTYKDVFGITPYQQVLQLRLKKAGELLQKDMSLEDIAYDLGFSDRRSFTKAYKKAYAITPSEGRNVKIGRHGAGAEKRIT